MKGSERDDIYMKAWRLSMHAGLEPEAKAPARSVMHAFYAGARLPAADVAQVERLASALRTSKHMPFVIS